MAALQRREINVEKTGLVKLQFLKAAWLTAFTSYRYTSFTVVKKAEKFLVNDPSLDFRAPPRLGTSAAVLILLGAESDLVNERRVLGAQSLFGIGALWITAEFLRRCRPTCQRRVCAQSNLSQPSVLVGKLWVLGA
ncbi:hypothetical protein BV898_12972 [Hypsibius exemplaris]|uniref:Uncharacterized protein n=1 Tax=Hypsibius exemplaris TaxID=2072580 RepID=A0A1W0WC04_HYPEX|nr:hypothetical protein BV898_12972 [Hypsibius exemplaris]